MASQTFNFVPGGGEVQDSSTVTVGAGEAAIVRFSAFASGSSARLGVTSNGVTTYISIAERDDRDDASRQYWVAPVLPGDVVFVRGVMNGYSNSLVAGILETK